MNWDNMVAEARATGMCVRKHRVQELHFLGLGYIFEAIESHGGRALFAGGCVRDAFFGAQPKDIDVEVYGINAVTLQLILDNFGMVDTVGATFGACKLTIPDYDQDGNSLTIDFTLARRETRLGASHRDFAVSCDLDITPQEACARRDFTLNAMLYDPTTEELHDYYGGAEDLANRVLEPTSMAFSEDTLRVLRGMQFVARFDLTPTDNLYFLARTMTADYAALPKSRIMEEWMKLATKGKFPGSCLDYLANTGWLALYPQLEAIRDVQQNAAHHPEGSVDTHTMHVTNAAARIADREGLKGDDRAVLVLAAICHDLGKATTTKLREKNGVMRWTAYGHEAAGVEPASEFLHAIGIKKDIIRRVLPLVANHMVLFQVLTGTSLKMLRRLAVKCHPATIEELLWLIEADSSGRPPLPVGLPEEGVVLRDAAAADGLLHGAPKRLIEGRDVLPFYDGKAGPAIGEHVSHAYEAQIGGKFTTREEALAWLQERFANKSRLVDGQMLIRAGYQGPQIGNALKVSREAQKNGQFSDTPGAEQWVRDYSASTAPTVSA